MHDAWNRFFIWGPFCLAPDLSLMSELTRLADRLARIFDAYQLKLQVNFSRFRSKRSLRGRLHMLKTPLQ